MRTYNLKFFKIRRRAVVRTIDFLVSFTLFIILLTQFYLIIINMNLNLSSTSTKEENPAQLITDKLLTSTGSANWGTTSGVPQNFGLAADARHPSFNNYLDLAKFAHLNGELQYNPINSSYSYITPEIVLTNLTGTQANVQFRISTRPIMQVQASETHTGTTASLTVKTLTWNNLSIPNVDVSSYLVSLSTGAYSENKTIATNSDGQAIIPNTIGTDNYIAVIYAHSQDLWGINWVVIQNTGGSIVSTDITPFTLNNPVINTNSILQYVTTPLNTLTIRSTSGFYSANKSTMYFTVTSGSGSINTSSTNVGTNSPFIQVYTMHDTTNNIYYYRVVTQPLIFDNFNFISPNGANYSTCQFPVYQTNNFQNANSGTIYTYSTPVMTQRGPILFTVDYSS